MITATVTDFPPEFAPVLENSQKVHQLAEQTIAPGADTDIDSPGMTEMASAILRATVNTYPEVDALCLGMPEFRQWSGSYEAAWQRLDDKYDFSEVVSLSDVLAAASQRPDYPGGVERALDEVKGDIVALYFYDRLLTDLNVLADTQRPDLTVIINSAAEELFPVLSRILPAGAETLNVVDYTPSRILRRRERLRQIPGPEIPSVMIFTLHDDNVGLLPQLETGPLHELTSEVRNHGWAGFSTRYWLIGDHSPCVAYLAKAAWDENATPEAVYRDQIRAACGAACVGDMLTVFREVEATTMGLEWHGMGLTFPVPGMIMKQWKPEPLSAELAGDRQSYQRALDAANSAREVAEAGADYIDYWIGRLEFGIGYLNVIEAVRSAAIAESGNQQGDVLRHAKTALGLARGAIAAYAEVARDQCDRGAIATLNEYVYRPLRAKVEELGSEADQSDSTAA